MTLKIHSTVECIEISQIGNFFKQKKILDHKTKPNFSFQSTLFQVGAEQSYGMGAYMRRRYASLLENGRYSHDIVHAQSKSNVKLTPNHIQLYIH